MVTTLWKKRELIFVRPPTDGAHTYHSDAGNIWQLYNFSDISWWIVCQQKGLPCDHPGFEAQAVLTLPDHTAFIIPGTYTVVRQPRVWSLLWWLTAVRSQLTASGVSFMELHWPQWLCAVKHATAFSLIWQHFVNHVARSFVWMEGRVYEAAYYVIFQTSWNHIIFVILFCNSSGLCKVKWSCC
jgi:hypothetical protein